MEGKRVCFALGLFCLLAGCASTEYRNQQATRPRRRRACVGLEHILPGVLSIVEIARDVCADPASGADDRRIQLIMVHGTARQMAEIMPDFGVGRTIPPEALLKEAADVLRAADTVCRDPKSTDLQYDIALLRAYQSLVVLAEVTEPRSGDGRGRSDPPNDSGRRE